MGRSLAITAVWLALLLSLLGALDAWPKTSAWQRLANPSLWPATLAFAGLFVGVACLRAWRWRMLLKREIELPWRRIWPIFFWTFLLKSLTPLRAGEVVRALWLRQRLADGLGYGLGVLGVERGLDAVVLVGGGGLVVLAARAPLADGARLAVALAVVIALALAVLLGPQLAARVGGWLPSAWGPSDSAGTRGVRERLARGARAVGRALMVLRDPWLALRALGVTLLIWAGLALGFGLLLTTLLPELAWSAVLCVLVSVNVLGLVTATPANVGPFEVGAMAGLAVFGIGAGQALPAVVALHAAVIASTVAVGLLGRLALQHQLARAHDLY